MVHRAILLVIGMSLCCFSTSAAQGAVVSGSDLYQVNLETGEATLVAEIGDGESIIGLALHTGSSETGPALALTTDNELIEFNVTSPDALGGRLQVTGLESGESLVGIDFRPASNEVWAISDQSRLYQIDLSSGEATSMRGVLNPTLTDTNVGFDFNPTSDRIRLEGMTGQNLGLSTGTGSVSNGQDESELAVNSNLVYAEGDTDAATKEGVVSSTTADSIDADLVYAKGDANEGSTPEVVGVAHTNNHDGAQVTEQFVIDVGTQSLAIQTRANAGTLNTVGPLGVEIVAWASFDISPLGDAYMTNPNIISMPSTGSGKVENDVFESVFFLVAGAAVTSFFGVKLLRMR